MNNWNELNCYAQAKVEARRHEAEEWRLAQLTQGNTQEEEKGTALSFALPQVLNGFVVRLRAMWLRA